MTIHVNIREAEARLSELVDAAIRGEDVVLNQAGSPQVRFTMVPPDDPEAVERRAAKRRAAIGMFKHLVGDRNIDVQAIKADQRWDEHYERKFGDTA